MSFGIIDIDDDGNMRKRMVWAWGAAIVCFVVLMIVTPAIPQNEAYHDFADQRNFFGDFSLS